MSKKTQLPSLEDSLAEINSLIDVLENGGLSLEQSLLQFERGVALIRHSQKILQEAEQKVQVLLKNNENEILSPYENPEE